MQNLLEGPEATYTSEWVGLEVVQEVSGLPVLDQGRQSRGSGEAIAPPPLVFGKNSSKTLDC